jgi:hypothetical protein
MIASLVGVLFLVGLWVFLTLLGVAVRHIRARRNRDYSDLLRSFDKDR